MNMKKKLTRLTSTLLACSLMFSALGVGFAAQPANTAAVAAAISKAKSDVVSTVEALEDAAAILLSDQEGQIGRAHV